MKIPGWHQVRAVLLLPGIVTVLIPLVILLSATDIYIGWSFPQIWKSLPILIGLLLLGFGLVLVGQTVRMFAKRGQGTLAPWEPPPNLVVVGVYRRVRNPMISGVFSILLGESIFFGSQTLLFWFLVVAGINLIYIPLVEEPQLAERFGTRYDIYRQHVPRWLPRLHSWTPPWE